MILVLTSTGWSITRNYFTNRERFFSIVGFILFIAFHFLQTTCTDGQNCGGYVLGFQAIKFVITFGVILGMNANIERLRVAARDYQYGPSRSDLFVKLRMFTSFRWVFLAYLILPVVLLFIDVLILTWQQSWIDYLLDQLLLFAIFVMIGHTFRPRHVNRYFRPPQDSVVGANGPGQIAPGGRSEEMQVIGSSETYASRQTGNHYDHRYSSGHFPPETPTTDPTWPQSPFLSYQRSPSNTSPSNAAEVNQMPALSRGARPSSRRPPSTTPQFS
eukprot:TRINITY_DN6378_c0_g1_i1.p1 TRINITY_DN6378_c0_g1~~TRINITY_DN6378_c0_g1_i1.p1  ORF type:complete len:273 (+),score=45.95 TRINITY_DN6378_c0_g1_i1:247-1065(+)